MDQEMLSIRLDGDIFDALTAIANRENTTRTELVRQALVSWLLANDAQSSRITTS
jgi:predicted transcriptional regulator